MVREVITINVGGCGIRMGHRIWKQYCAEAHISSDGNISLSDDHNKHPDHTFETFFRETKDGKYQTRNLMVDTDRNVIENVKKCPYSAIYDENGSLFGNEGANNNFAKAHYRLGPEMMDEIKDRLRKIVNHCDNVQGFIINHSVGGGTGSGLGTLILEGIAVDYRKKNKFGFEVLSSPTISDCVVDPYNALLTTHRLLDYTEESVILDNVALYDICQNQLEIKRPTNVSLNQLIAKAVSSITSSLRFESGLHVDLNEFQMNLIQFPRLHFLITSMAPVTTEKKKETTYTGIYRITEQCVASQSFFAKIDDFDVEEDKYMALGLYYRGYSLASKQLNTVVQRMKSNKKLCFVEWVPTGFKVEMTETPAAAMGDDELATCRRNVVMIGNNTVISRVFSERFSKKYDRMYSQRAFVHWYVGEGMEECEFAEAQEDLGFLEKDYLDVLYEQATDESDCDGTIVPRLKAHY